MLGHVADDLGGMIDRRLFYGDDLVDERDDPVFRASMELLEATVDGVAVTGLPARSERPLGRFDVTEDYLLMRSIEDGEPLSVHEVVRYSRFRCDDHPGGTVQEGPPRDPAWYEMPFMEVDWSRQLVGAAFEQPVVAPLGTVVGRRQPVPIDADLSIDGARVSFTTWSDLIVASPGDERACDQESPPAACLRVRLMLRHHWEGAAP